MAVTLCSSESQFEKAAVQQFEMVARVSSPSWAHIRALGVGTDMFMVESMWEQRNLVMKEKTRFKRSHLVRRLPGPDGQRERIRIEQLAGICPTDMSNVGMMSISPSGKYIAILRNEKDCNEKKQYLEVRAYKPTIVLLIRDYGRDAIACLLPNQKKCLDVEQLIFDDDSKLTNQSPDERKYDIVATVSLLCMVL
jgi:hypothetical protein